MNPLLQGLAEIVAGVSGAKNVLYDSNFLKAVKVSVPVISLGNLTVGGTGKTPVTAFCLKLLLEKGHRPGLVCRSYRGNLKSPKKVDPKNPGEVSHVGDEALWYAEKFPNVPVWSGPVKSETARALVAAEKIDVLLVDDGFQHRKLHRDLNLLLLDSTDSQEAYECVPAGRARENFVNWKRANGILWTKTNLAKGPKIAKVSEFPVALPKFEFESVLKTPSANLKNVLLVSGIARPESFRALVEQNCPQVKLHELIFRDHHPYGPEDVQKIENQAKESGAEEVWTTEKDEVKLRSLWRARSPPLRALSLEAKLKGSVESFYELLARPLS